MHVVDIRWVVFQFPFVKNSLYRYTRVRVRLRRGGRCSHHVVYKLIYKSKDCIFTLLIYPCL